MNGRAPRHLLVALALLLPWGCAPAKDAEPPSIVLVVIDTLRRDVLPMYGGEAHAPNLSDLARSGIQRDALASFHQTSMSMGALFTGHTPSLESGDPAKPLAWRPVAWCGMGRFTALQQPGVCLPEGLPTLGEALSERGYHTVGVVANALLHDPAGFSRGFDRWVEVGRLEGRPAPHAPKRNRAAEAARRRTWESVNEALRPLLDEPAEGPRFVYLHYLDVHDWIYRDMGYVEAVEHMDRGIGELLDILAEGGLSDAAILVTSDHGELLEDRARVLPHHPLHLGNPSFREVLEVPFLLTGAGDHEHRLPATIRSEDVHRILLSLAGAEPRAPSDLEADELLVTEQHYQTYQRGRFKSLHERGDGFVLIDLESDPGETRDVAAAHPEVVAAHRARVTSLARKLAAEQLAADADPSAAPLDPHWTERLRSLGYVE